MTDLKQVMRQGAWLAVAVMAGWWLHGNRVTAAEGAAPEFQWQNMGPDASLSVYYPSDHVLYVYRGALNGNGRVNCAYQFKVNRQGEALERSNCAPGRAF